MTQAFSIYTSDTSPAGDLAYIDDPLLVIDDERYIHTVDGNVLPNTALLGYNGEPIAGGPPIPFSTRRFVPCH